MTNSIMFSIQKNMEICSLGKKGNEYQQLSAKGFINFVYFNQKQQNRRIIRFRLGLFLISVGGR